MGVLYMSNRARLLHFTTPRAFSHASDLVDAAYSRARIQN